MCDFNWVIIVDGGIADRFPTCEEASVAVATGGYGWDAYIEYQPETSVDATYNEVRGLLDRLNERVNECILYGSVEELDALRGMRTHIEDSIDIVRECRHG